MLQIILLIIIGVLYFKFGYRLVPSIKIVVGGAIAVVTIVVLTYTIGIIPLILLILLAGIGVYLFYITENKKAEQEIYEWRNKQYRNFDSFEFSNIVEHNTNDDFVRYKSEDIPYNRMIYFASGSKENNDSDRVFPIYYHAFGSKDNVNFEEHGFLVTSAEIVIKKHKPDVKRDGEDTLTLYIPFNNIYKVTRDGNNLTVYYANKEKINIDVLSEEESDLIYNVLDIAVKTGWSLNVKNYISDSSEYQNDNRLEEVEKTVDYVKNKLDKETRDRIMQEVFANSSAVSSAYVEATNNQINSRFSGSQGHGHVGEQAGNVLDRFKLKQATPLGQENTKHGADRKIEGMIFKTNPTYIQTKYHKTAGSSIGSCFEGKQAKYIAPDGRMMQIEVPRDQYSQSVKLMERRIKNGEVPHENNPSNAYKYVKKGALSYEHAQIATKSIFDRKSEITINNQTRVVTFREKLVWSAGLDFATGVSVALPTSIVSSVWVFCNNRWRGKDFNEALKDSAKVFGKSLVMAGGIYMFSSQFARSSLGDAIANKFLGGVGKQATNTMIKGSMIAVTAAITVGPDVIRALSGKISFKQLVKNTVVTGGGMAAGATTGAAIGSTLGPVGSAVGVAIGASVGGFVTKKVVDMIIEDDAVMMIQIAKEEFIDTIMMSGLSKEEFEDALNKTFLHKQFGKFLQEMYSKGDEARAYVRERYNTLISEYYDTRELPSEEEIIDVIATEVILDK